MPTNFPTALDALTNPTPADNLNTPAVLHTDQHANTNDAIEAIEAKIGIDGSADTASIDYKLAAKFGGTVTTNTIPKATGAITFGNSALSDDGTNVTVTGENLIPSGDGLKDFGSSTKRWNEIRAQTLAVHNGSAGTITISNYSNVIGSTILTGGGGGTSSITATNSSFALGLTNKFIAGAGAVTITANYGGFVFGAAGQYVGNFNATMTAVKAGAFLSGYCFGGSTRSGSMDSSGYGSFCSGQSYAGVIKATQTGSFAQGYVGQGTIEATGTGSFAQGAVSFPSAVTKKISASGFGSFAQGAIQNSASGNIIASNTGSFAHGVLGGSSTGSITSSGAGSFAAGYCQVAGNSITASGSGSFAFGMATTAIISATGTNSSQFGVGTNATNNSFQFGKAVNIDFGSAPAIVNLSLLTTGVNLKLDATTGTKIGTATTQKLGFWNVAPIVQPSAFTQTYATATKTHAALTSATLTDSSGGTANTTVAAVAAGTDLTTNATINDNFADLTAQVNALRVDVTNVKQVVNAVIDDLQLEGLLA